MNDTLTPPPSIQSSPAGPSSTAGSTPHPTIMNPGRRALLVAVSWMLIGLAQPGVLRADGFGHLAFFAIGPWAYAAARPGRRAFAVEWGVHSLGLAGVFAWMIQFMPAILAPMSIIPALYPAFAGVLLRRAARWPLALLAPAAWTLAEVVRWSLPVPFSFGWFRLGFLMHDTAWIVGSAAWFGTWGLTWAMAALGGLAADVVGSLIRPAGERSNLPVALPAGLLPLALMVGLSAKGGAPEMREGPDILVVQPGIEQGLKTARRNPFKDLYVPQVSRTLTALYETRPEGVTGPAAQPDLVLWGETFLPGKLTSEAVFEAFDAGARPAEWARRVPVTRDELEYGDFLATDLAATLFGKGRSRQSAPYWRSTFGAPDGPEWSDRVMRSEMLLPPGTSFLSGVEAWTLIDGEDGKELRSQNGVCLWDSQGRRSKVASKVHVVPGGEASDPLTGIPFFLEAVRKVANAVPDFVGAEEATVLTLRTPGRGAFRLGIAVCYDNAFDDPFTAPIRRGPVDFFVVASNEAWYGKTPEMDHMLAFTRMAAAASGRAIVRATNSGISALVGPDGRVLEVLEEGGERKMVAGALRARVPVPVEESASQATFFVRTEAWQARAWGALGALILLIAAAAGRRAPSGA